MATLGGKREPKARRPRKVREWLGRGGTTRLRRTAPEPRDAAAPPLPGARAKASPGMRCGRKLRAWGGEPSCLSELSGRS